MAGLAIGTGCDQFGQLRPDCISNEFEFCGDLILILTDYDLEAVNVHRQDSNGHTFLISQVDE